MRFYSSSFFLSSVWLWNSGACISVVGWSSVLQAGRSWVRYPTSLLYFQCAYSFQPQFGPGVDWAYNRNKYRKIFLEGKVRPAHKADTSPSCVSQVPIKWESLPPMGNRDLLQGQLHLYSVIDYKFRFVSLRNFITAYHSQPFIYQTRLHLNL
jgi:hypothetical protein